LITRAVPAAPAAVGKQRERHRVLGNRQVTREDCAPSGICTSVITKQNRDLFRGA
jgi:hypothetical protein